MFLADKDLMFSIGYITVVFYLASFTCFFLGMLYSSFFVPGLILGAVFFGVSSLIIAVMMKKRFGT